MMGVKLEKSDKNGFLRKRFRSREGLILQEIKKKIQECRNLKFH